MDKEEYLTFLQEKIEYFDNVSIGDFQLLSVLDSESLSIIDVDVCQVTPLLKQICDYALISYVFEDYELEKLEKSLNKNSNIYLNEILGFSEKCCEYIAALLGEDCTHPSILKKLNLTNGFSYITTFSDNVMNLLDNVNDDMYDSIIDFGNYIEDKFDNIMEEIFDNILKKIKKHEINLNKELLIYLKNYAKNLLSLSVLNTKYSNSDKEETINIIINHQSYIRIFDDSSAFPGLDIKTYDLITSFVLIIKKLEEYKRNKNISKELLNKINELIELYNAYYSCKYECIKNTIDEQKILEKCKKM